MADVNRGNRPLSPHLTVFDQSYTGYLSILHRITGVALTLGVFLIVWWFLAAAYGGEYFECIDGLLTSWFGALVMIGSLWALYYHFCNGIRHLFWDFGAGISMEKVKMTGYVVLGASIALTVITLIVAI